MSSAVQMWIWIDHLERRYGARHVVHPLPANWRSSVKVGSYAIPAYNPLTQQYRTVTWADLSDEDRSYLCTLGYDQNP
jgi:hypothetical protein